MEKNEDRYKRSYPISWEQLHRDSKALSWRLHDMNHDMNRAWKGIVAVTRGGLVPAAVISRELGIHHIDTVCITSYDWQNQGEPRILKSVEGSGKDLLIIDDLVDTGSTARIVRKMLPEAYFATVYAKPAGKPLVDAYVTEVSQDTWILFPWDSESRFVEPIAGK
ncbi:MAG: xanthine phosphoribosyltransferase [Desulfobacteraceae bacterium]|nr:xanthine phosphoribosyltransferase [Desulfobacteraceae bacterium]